MALFEDKFQFVKIATDEMEGGQDVLSELMNGRQGGLPWMVILDGDGTELVSSNNEKGTNVGCPVDDFEIDHFVEMIKISSDKTEEQLGEIKSRMIEYAKTLR